MNKQEFQIGVCRAALALTSSSTITSLDENSIEARACETLWCARFTEIYGIPWDQAENLSGVPYLRLRLEYLMAADLACKMRNDLASSQMFYERARR